MLTLMVKTVTGWEMLDNIVALEVAPDCLGVQIDPALTWGEGIAELEVGSEVRLDTAKIKTFVNQGLCSRGFESHYYSKSHSSKLSSEELGVTLVIKHDENRPYSDGRRTRGGGMLKRAA